MAVQYKALNTGSVTGGGKNQALLMFGAGTGLTAKCADLEGEADLVAVYSTAMAYDGTSTLLAWMPYEDCNARVKQMGGRCRWSKPLPVSRASAPARL